MLDIQNITITLKQDLRVLIRDFSFTLSLKNRKVALIGEEGNGKSTLLKAIYDPSLVEAYVDLKGEIHTREEVIGYLPQIIGGDWEDFSAREILNKQIPWERFDYNLYYSTLADLGIKEDWLQSDHPACRFSGGEKIKFALMLELMKEPSLLLLDEPSNDLDLESVEILQQFIRQSDIPILFVSHDEELLEACAETIIHFEQLVHKTIPLHTVAVGGYREYIEKRNLAVARQNQQARKEKEIYDQKIERFQRIYERVQHELRSVSRQAPSAAKNLKDKMHSVKSMGKRFEREKEGMTRKRIVEDKIDLFFDEGISLPNSKEILRFEREELRVGSRTLSRSLKLMMRGTEKVCVVGPNGCGKTTFLREVMKELESLNVACGYMPQQYEEELDLKRTPVEFLTRRYSKEEHTQIRTYLGSLNFTAEEMLRPISSLSGGQKAKLYFAKMISEKAQFLILDEPTRNLSPLSGPEIRAALKRFGGGILAVSHDRAFIREVFDRVMFLSPGGLKELDLGHF